MTHCFIISTEPTLYARVSIALSFRGEKIVFIDPLMIVAVQTRYRLVVSKKHPIN